MQLKYLRVDVFYRLMRGFSARMRARRMHLLIDRMGVKDGLSVLDVGGQPEIWDCVPAKLNITMLNLPGIVRTAHSTHHTIRYVEGDACDIQGLDGMRFDLIFSNSVIEHVGHSGKRLQFAREVQRFGVPFWVQTPSIYFPIEPHNGMPFWWWYPTKVRAYFIRKWREKLPAWTEMVETTDIVLKSELQTLFPTSEIVTERFWGIPKSYVAMSKTATA